MRQQKRWQRPWWRRTEKQGEGPTGPSRFRPRKSDETDTPLLEPAISEPGEQMHEGHLDASERTWGGNHVPSFEHVQSSIHEVAASDWLRRPAEGTEGAPSLRLAHTLTALIASDRERDLIHDLDLAITRLQGYDFERAVQLAQMGFETLEPLQILALAHTSDLYRALVGDLTGRLSTNERSQMFTRVRDLTGLLVGAGDLSRDLLSLLKRLLELGGKDAAALEQHATGGPPPDERRELLLACIRSCTLHLACFLRTWGTLLFSQEVTSWFQQFLWGKDYTDMDQQAFEGAVAGYLDLYLILAILDLQLDGESGR